MNSIVQNKPSPQSKKPDRNKKKLKNSSFLFDQLKFKKQQMENTLRSIAIVMVVVVTMRHCSSSNDARAIGEPTITTTICLFDYENY